MPEVSCEECRQPIPDRDVVCPSCGHSPRLWRDTLAEAWRDGLSQGWKAAAAFPVIYLLAIFTIQPPHVVAPLLPRMVPWLLLLAVQGFVAATTVVSAVALGRSLHQRSRKAGVWAWSEHAVIGVIVVGGFWIYTAMR